MEVMRKVAVGSLVVCVVFLNGCSEEPEVEVVYEQLANFYSYKNSPDAFSESSAGNGMFVLYRIKSIENAGSTQFDFSKYNVWASASNHEISNDVTNNDFLLLGPHLIATPIEVAPGQSVAGPGCFIAHVRTEDPKQLASPGSLVDLFYPDNNVEMTRMTGNNSVTVISTALPSDLQALCID